MKIVLKHVSMPEFQFVDAIPVVPGAEYEARLSALVQAAASDWILVYADREHYANLAYLINYDPRFEEGLLVLGPGGKRVLIVGNEGMGYLSILRASVPAELCQTFSLNSQPRTAAPRLKDVLFNIGLRAGQTACLVGWKYLEAEETDDLAVPAFLPAFYVEVLRALLGPSGRLWDGTRLLMDPGTGLRAVNSAAQIAAFEAAARSASAAVFGILRGVRPGMSEAQAARLMGYAGQPQTMHPILVSGQGEINGLRSPGPKLLEYGDGVSTALGYWGSLCCRAGQLVGQADAGFFDSIAAPYFKAVATLYNTMRIGVMGDEVFQAVAQAFAGSGLHSVLNPGHLTSFEEWLSSPIRPESREQVRSGMVFQSDIIPSPLPVGRMMNCEDTLAVADAGLRAELQMSYPGLWGRIQRRRRLMGEGLGLRLAEELLPLSDGAAYLPPFWLASDLVCAVE